MVVFKKNEEDWESNIIDSTIIKAHQHAAGAIKCLGEQAIGKSRGGKSTKIHVVVDALGLPIDFKITGGQVDDSVPAIELLEGKDSENIIADKAYDTDKIRKAFENKQVVIPNNPRRSQKYEYDKHLYKERHLVECFIGRIKNFRRIATRYEKTAIMYSGMVILGCILAWI